MRLKILGLVALAALVAAMGTLGLSNQAARADALPTPVATNAAGVISVSGFFNEDDSCSTGVTTCSASVSVSPAAAVTVGLALARCDIDLNSNASVADEAVVAAPGNCVGPADSDASAAIYTLSNAVVAGLDGNAADTINNLWRLNLTFTCNVLINTTLVITYQQDNIASSTTVTCNSSGAAAAISITKIDQNAGIRGATFTLSNASVGAGLNLIGTMVTSGVSSTTNPCISNVTAVVPTPAGMVAANANVSIAPQPCATNIVTVNAGQFPASCGNVLGTVYNGSYCNGITLPTGVPIQINETGAPATCTLVEIKLGGAGSTTVLPLAAPVVATFDGAAWSVSSNGTPFGVVNGGTLALTYVNSCAIAGGAVSANSAIVPVLGGSTQGLTNSTHIEIVPAPGSDDDARIDIRARDGNATPLVNAHVTVLIDRGSIALRADTTGSGAIGYDVVEPAPGATYFGSNQAGDTCEQYPTQFFSVSGVYPPNVGSAPYSGGVYTPTGIVGSNNKIADGYTNSDGIVSACLYVNDAAAPGITPGKVNITAIIENPSPVFSSYQPVYAPQNLVLTAVVTVVGPPASVKVAASPTTLQCGEKSTITATVTDSVGQNVSDHTRIELVSNFGSTIGGTGATLGFPGTGPVNPVSSSAAETFSGVATAFLLTSTEHVGPYEVVIATGGSTGLGNYNASSVIVGQGVTNTNVPTGLVNGPTYGGSVGLFSTAPVSAQATVTCALPVAVAPIVPPIVAPRTGEGIRPPNTGDAGLADTSGGSSTLFIVGGLVFAVAGIVTLKVARQ